MIKKSLILLLVILSLNLVSATIEITKDNINPVVISEINVPAIINLNIRNLGNLDNFEVYSLISGVNILPAQSFEISAGQTKTIKLEISLSEGLRERTGFFTFSYKIRGQNTGIIEDTVTINIVSLKEAFNIGTYNINPGDKQATIFVENKLNISFSEIKASFNSAFFSKDETFSLQPLEKKEISVDLSAEKIKRLVAGQYILTGNIEVQGAKEKLEGKIKYVEQSGLAVRDESSGIIFHTRIIEKTNEGNLPVVAEVTLKRDIISRLFTRFSPEPTSVDRNWIQVTYDWKIELRPGEVLAVNVYTNYLYPLIFLIIIIIGAYLIYIFKSSHLNLDKKVHFVRTKGGEFALKVVLTASTKKYVENIKIIDKLPGIVKIYEKFPSYQPDKIDEKNRRIEWSIPALNPGEERVFSYIIYSRIGVVGRFELPAALAVYDKEGKTKRAFSNKAFFVNEAYRRPDEQQ